MPSTPNKTDSHPALSLLTNAHPPATATTIHTTRILHKPLLLRKTSPPPSTTARTARRAARKEKTRAQAKRSRNAKPAPLSARQRRALGVDELGKNEKWEDYAGLRGLWGGYVREILGLNSGGDTKEGGGGGSYVTAPAAGPVLAAADMHGAEVAVVKSGCGSRVGLAGTVVQDRKMVLVVVCRGGGVKTIPKEQTVFRVEVPLLGREGEEAPKPLVFEVHGEMLRNRAPERARKSFKLHYRPDL